MKEFKFGGNEVIAPDSLSFSRHAQSAKKKEGRSQSVEFTSLSEEGVEQSRKTAREEMLKLLDNAPNGAVLFIGASSDQLRAKETNIVYGEELNEVSKERKDLFVLTKKEIDARKGDVIGSIVNDIRNNPDKKIVVDYPLYIKELGYAYRDRWTRKDPATGKRVKTEYFEKILDKYNDDHAKAIHDWLENNGVLTLNDGTVTNGPKPEDVAKEYIRGLLRVYQFAKKLIPNRPIMVHGNGHQWDLDAVVTYLAKGKVSRKDFMEVMSRSDQPIDKQVIGNTEIVSDIIINTDGTTHVKYRDQDFESKMPEQI